MVPHELTDCDQRLRLEFAHELLAQYSHDPRCIEWVITTDKSWFHLWDPRNKYESMEWLKRDENRGQVVSRERSVNKVMFLPFFDSKGLVHREYFHNQTINKEVFLPIIKRAWEAVKTKRGSEVWNNREEYLLHMDNASAHCSDLVQGHLRQIHWNTLKHPPYSPDLSPCDYFLFPRLKKKLRGHKYPSIEALVVSIERELGAITSHEWRQCFKDWVTRCKHCVLFEGNYFEGMKHDP